MRINAIGGSRRTGFITMSAIAGAVTLTAAACGSPATSSAAAGASPTHTPMASHSAAASAVFGSDCGMVPATGMGSLHGMMTDPVVTAASHNPLLTALAADIKAAGLTSTLDSMGSITVFAPENSAFTSLPAADMTMMHSAAELAKILKYHVVDGHITTAELASGKPLTTLEGSTLTPSLMGAVYE
ncbi:MAG: fasciclin domain-containing protein, partial [Actinomycetes bacterium]